MTLEVQIQSLIYSFVYGLFLALLMNLGYRYLFTGKKWRRYLFDFLFVLASAILYFALLRMINEGIIHPYFLLSLFLGAILGNRKTKIVRRKIQ